MGAKEQFIEIYKENIKREGSDKLLEYLKSSDFFQAPASSRYHSHFEEGLCEHSIKVYERLKRLVEQEDSLYNVFTNETIAIVGLLHDLCKINFYQVDYKNVKEDGIWVSKPYYKINEALPFGHGEKSVYIINKFMQLTDVEALSIDWHMGPHDARIKGGQVTMLESVYKISALPFLTHIADSMATYLDENDND